MIIFGNKVTFKRDKLWSSLFETMREDNLIVDGADEAIQYIKKNHNEDLMSKYVPPKNEFAKVKLVNHYANSKEKELEEEQKNE